MIWGEGASDNGAEDGGLKSLWTSQTKEIRTLARATRGKSTAGKKTAPRMPQRCVATRIEDLGRRAILGNSINLIDSDKDALPWSLRKRLLLVASWAYDEGISLLLYRFCSSVMR